MGRRNTSVDFWNRVIIKADITKCCLWSGYKEDDGYGILFFDCIRDRAHRVAYKLFHGAIPDKIKIRHSCDNPPCCNPYHLIAGTHKQNMEDMAKRERSRSTKLNGAVVTLIKQRLYNGEKGSVFSEEYGVTRAAICDINRGRSWKHIELHATQPKQSAASV